MTLAAVLKKAGGSHLRPTVSRKKAIVVFLGISTIGGSGAPHAVNREGAKPTMFYATCVLMAVGVVYSAMFFQVAAEHLGSNIRSTITTSVPSLARGAKNSLTAAF